MQKQSPDIYFDELDKLCVVDPQVISDSTRLRDECKSFLDSAEEFHTLISGFIDKIDTLGNLVEKEKLKAIGTRIKLHSAEKLREQKKQELTIKANMKRNQLDRLAKELASWKQCEKEQMEEIDKLSNLN